MAGIFLRQNRESEATASVGSITVGLCYNLKTDAPKSVLADAVAEYDDHETVQRIAVALESGGYRVVHLPYRAGLLTRLENDPPDIVFNLAEGWFGRNREALVPAVCEMLEIPYTGSDPLTLSLALDKAMAKQIVAAHGIPTAASQTITEVSQVERIAVDYPVFIKPNCEGSSKGIRDFSRANNRDELRTKVEWVLENYHQPVLVEKYLPGREFTVGVLGNTDPIVFPIMEVRPGKAGSDGIDKFIYSFETKTGNLEQLLCPAPIDDHLDSVIRQLASQVYRALGCRDLARVDFRLDENGRPNFLEVNPLPGLSPVSLYPAQAAAGGMSFPRLIRSILRAGIDRYPQISSQEERIIVDAPL